MFSINCDDCDNSLMFDYDNTVDNYTKEVDYKTQPLDFIMEKVLANYLLYVCSSCDKKYKYTYKELERKLRESVSKDVVGAKKAKMFREDINFDLIKPGCGVEYCGQCTGIDNKGNCSLDLIKQCTIRKK